MTWIWIFHHLVQLTCRFCQIPYDPSRIRRTVEYWNLKSTHPRSANTSVTLYGSLTLTSKHGYGGFLTGNGMLSRMVCTEGLTSAIATLALDCTLSFNRSRGSERVIFLKLRLPQISCCSMLISEKPFPRNPLLILQAQVFFLGCLTRL